MAKRKNKILLGSTNEHPVNFDSRLSVRKENPNKSEALQPAQDRETEGVHGGVTKIGEKR